LPSVPQLEAGWVAQVLRGSSPPFETGVQRPGVAARAQLRQPPAQA
jgi:hypothetical protein